MLNLDYILFYNKCKISCFSGEIKAKKRSALKIFQSFSKV